MAIPTTRKKENQFKEYSLKLHMSIATNTENRMGLREELESLWFKFVPVKWRKTKQQITFGYLGVKMHKT